MRGTLAAVVALMFQDSASVAFVVGRKNDENAGRRDWQVGVGL